MNCDMPFLYPVRQPVIKLLIILSYVMPSKDIFFYFENIIFDICHLLF